MTLVESPLQNIQHNFAIVTNHLFADIINAKLTLSAEAILHALIIIRSSIRLSFTSPLPVCEYNVLSYLWLALRNEGKI